MAAEGKKPARRSHKKSRNGCKECKRRHLKCDENRPSCVNCTRTNHRCSYIDLYHSRGLTSHETPSQSATETFLSRLSPSVTPALSETAASSASCSPGLRAESSEATTDGIDAVTDHSSGFLPPRVFDIYHLGLLHHLENEIASSRQGWLVADLAGTKLCYEAIFRSAMKVPYLMDQLLAFSALHLSTLQPDDAKKADHLREASKLQTRALELFNMEKPEVNEENAMAMLIFSSLVGLHCLFVAVSSRDDFTDFLDNTIKFLKLHHGVQAIVHQGWQFVRESEIKQIVNAIEDGNKYPSRERHSGNECDHVGGLLETYRDKLDPKAYDACCSALRVLRWVMSSRHALPKPYPTHITMAWPILITPEFVELLEQRQPASLALLAHWAMLLHFDREFWVFGDAGKFMIESLSKYLGRYWEEWLVVPKEALDSP
ncbi:hypothetical protein GQ53DRAFT_637945 [Thozetella sp. PMI_491]|nr:hypothetical protein GQ53DRAFT_637945 [Thozetella sp. PMI_491]